MDAGVLSSALPRCPRPSAASSCRLSHPLHDASIPAARRLRKHTPALVLRTTRSSEFPCNENHPSWTLLTARCAVRFRPCIDIHKGKVKQIVWSTLKDSESNDTSVTNFETDKSPAEYANLYKNDGLTGGQVMMLDVDTSTNSAALEAIHAYPGGLQIGGGININLDNALSYLEEGASHVIVTAYSDGKMDVERLRNLANVTGKNRLVLELSCRKKNGRYAFVADRWQKFSDVFLDEETLCFLSTYADEFLVHGLDVEAKRSGIDGELVTLLGCFSPIPVTYAGGVATMSDLERIKVAGMERVDFAVFSSLDIFGGNLPYKDVVAWHKKQQVMLAQ